MPRLTVSIAVKAATLLVLCASLPISMASSAGAAPAGHHPAATSAPDGRTQHRRADSPPGSSSVQVRVLPPTASPTTPPSPTTDPNGPYAGDGDSAGAHSMSDNGVSADVDSGHWSGSGSSSHSGSGSRDHTGSYSHDHGRPHGGSYDRVHGGSPHLTGHGSRKHISRHASRHASPLHGFLPSTGRGMTAALLTGTATVLTGTLLLWLSSLRRRRVTPRT